jgi:hypothetical protein
MELACEQINGLSRNSLKADISFKDISVFSA